MPTENNVAAQAGDSEPRERSPYVLGVKPSTWDAQIAAQAGDEPMIPHHPEPHTHTWSALEAEAIRKYGAACRAAGVAQVSPRATADVEREETIAYFRKFAGSWRECVPTEEGAVKFIATTKPGA